MKPRAPRPNTWLAWRLAGVPVLAGCGGTTTARCIHASTRGAPTAHDESATEGHTPAHHHHFDDIERWAREFEAPERDAWQRPDQVIAQLELAPDARVADVGAGTGYFAVRLARALPAGHVWGLDVEPGMVRYLQQRATREGHANLLAALCAPDDPLVPEPVDVLLVVDTYHHIDARVAYFRNARRYLRPGGRVVIVDFLPDAPQGPPPHLRVPAEEVRRELAEAGYEPRGAPVALPYQYMLTFSARAE
jgi:SAM-dependent methyltransferase